MHEMAIADAVVGIAALRAHGARVSKIELRVGQMRQVVPPALHFAFGLASAGGPVEGAELELDVVEAAGICRTCGKETPLPGLPLVCRHCGGLDIDVVSGQELVVDAIEQDGRESLPGRPV
jgi:hydrogenase nickel incorporation protein HypA/HybF